jgi:CRISPR-associated endonuclease/helicase Cas3
VQERAAGKADRLLQIEQLLLAHPDGLTQAEIARRLGVNRSTVFRSKPDLDHHFAVYETDDGKLAINRDMYLTQVRFTLHEAMAVHLASRLMATTTDKHNPHAAAALRKLAESLGDLAPFISTHVRASADLMDDDAQRHDPVYLNVLETLTRAWSRGRKVRLKHQMPDLHVSDYTFAPYYIEPYAAGRTSHVIGYREPPAAIRTFKIERIRAIELLDDPYEIPATFDPRQVLADAWGIWYTDAEPVEVVLRFHPRVAYRVQETRWHRNERLDPLQADGHLIWRTNVAEPQELLPWVRGWGGDVEVLAPESLREAVMRDVRRLASVYGVGDVTPPPVYQLLWAKLSRDKTRAHPLICHMLDVALMALTLWRVVLTEGQRGQWAATLGLGTEAAGRLLAFWAGAHDLGKASPAFQRKSAVHEATLSQAGLPFERLHVEAFCPHGWITTVTLPDLLINETSLPARAAKRIARAVGGHHGAWPQPAQDQAIKSFERGGPQWDGVRLELLNALKEVLDPPSLSDWAPKRANDNALLTWFSGFTSVADWLGSMESHFPYAEAPVDLAAYANKAQRQAMTALHALRWTDWQSPTTALAFDSQFPFQPSSMQQAVIDLAETFEAPALVLIEAATGSGKTEAALYLADVWARRLQQRGIYVAMPTMATSNQMHTRVSEWLHRRYPEDALDALLVHSQARWTNAPPAITLQDESEAQETRTLAWFLPRKRSLLASCAVGTVDQALLSVLQARHFFVRLFGLSRKTIIFDEIHAYDTYMSTLFQRLLGWLRMMGASVILLSATLPSQTRRELLEAYAGHPIDVSNAVYPAINWATETEAGTVPLPAPENRVVSLDWISRDPDAVVDVLRLALVEGGCAAVICNTVARAQTVYSALKTARLVANDALTLFHARYPFSWRDSVEKRVLDQFGKQGTRPDRAIVVATQVIEQSLDLDFDVLVSDLAPVDLLIQRAGRLHRHSGRQRPVRVAAPRMVLVVDCADGSTPDFNRDIYVYEQYLLLSTFLALQGRSTLLLPQESPALLETVYGGESLPGASPALEIAYQKMVNAAAKDMDAARKRLIGKPEFEGLLSETTAGLAEDDPGIHAALQALTRIGAPSISLVCLHATAIGLNTEPDGTGVSVDPDRKPDVAIARALAGATVSVNRREIVAYFVAQEVPRGWRKHALLSDHRLAVFEGERSPLVNGLGLRLTRELGLEVESEIA